MIGHFIPTYHTCSILPQFNKLATALLERRIWSDLLNSLDFLWCEKFKERASFLATSPCFKLLYLLFQNDMLVSDFYIVSRELSDHIPAFMPAGHFASCFVLLYHSVFFGSSYCKAQTQNAINGEFPPKLQYLFRRCSNLGTNTDSPRSS